MNLSTIEQGEELLKRATPGPWDIDTSGVEQEEYYGYWHSIGPIQTTGKEADDDDRLIQFLINHASELLQAAREVEMRRN